MFILFALSSFLAFYGLVLGDVYYISPSAGDSCSASFCLSLPEFVAKFSYFSDFIKANTTVIFQPGYHYLESRLVVENTNNFSMVSNSNSSSSVIIICEEHARLYFITVSHVHICNLDVKCSGHQVRSVGQFTLRNCLFLNHTETAFQFVNSIAYITNSSFISNSGSSLQGRIELTHSHLLVGAAITVSMSNVTVVESVFEENTAEAGGAIFGDTHSNITIINSTFVRNHADCLNCFGGVLYSEGGCTVTVCNSIFQSNLADSFGGVFAVTESTLIIQSSIFVSNEANTGGVIYANRADKVIIMESNFTNNSANNSGGVLSAYSLSSVIIIIDSNFQNNRADRYAGVLDVFLNPTKLQEVSS